MMDDFFAFYENGKKIINIDILFWRRSVIVIQKWKSFYPTTQGEKLWKRYAKQLL